MKKIITTLSIVTFLICIVLGCKKDTKDNAPGCQYNCNYYSLLLNNKWVGIHYYEDTVSIAITNPLSMPLSTTYDYFDPSDTCTNETKTWFRSSGRCFYIWSTACSQHPGDTTDVGAWKLTGDHNDVLYHNGGVMKVLSLAHDTLKLHFINTLHLSNGDSIQYSNLRVYVSSN